MSKGLHEFCPKGCRMTHRDDPAYALLTDSFKSTPRTHRPHCSICTDMEYARLGMTLCSPCCVCRGQGKEGHIQADQGGDCDDCGHRICQSCYALPPKAEICTCATPCCSVDVGVGIITCTSQHCPEHGRDDGEQE